MSCLLVLLGSIASQAAPTAQQEDEPDGSADSQSLWERLPPITRNWAIGLGAFAAAGGAWLAYRAGDRPSSGPDPYGPAPDPRTGSIATGINFAPPRPSALPPDGMIRPPAYFGSRTWVRVLTSGLYIPDDEDGVCIENCIQRALRRASGDEKLKILNMVKLYDTCRGPGRDNCNVGEQSRYKPYDVLWHQVYNERQEARRREEEEEQRRRQEGSDRNKFSLANVPKALQGAVQGASLNRVASQFGAAVASQAGKVPKVLAPSFHPAAVGSRGFMIPKGPRIL